MNCAVGIARPLSPPPRIVRGHRLREAALGDAGDQPRAVASAGCRVPRRYNTKFPTFPFNDVSHWSSFSLSSLTVTKNIRDVES